MRSLFPCLHLSALLVVLLAGCASEPVREMSRPTSEPPVPASQEQPPREVVIPKPLTGRELVASLLPRGLPDKNGWSADIVAAFDALHINPTRDNVCAVLAEIGQESSFQSDPAVPGLGKIVRRELVARSDKYGIPQWLMEKSLEMQSPDGRTYDVRIDALRTENDVSDLYEDMISEIPFGKKLFAGYNPVRTGGPMQVSANFADAHMAAKRYPNARDGSLRKALFTRKGGLYFGVAYLLDYPAAYDSMRFRFADYHAGRYSSRNAAFQQAVRSLSGVALSRDGDLLAYENGVVREQPSRTMRALLSIATRLRMDRQEIFHDLKMEKSAAFEQSQLYGRVYALAPPMPHAAIPEIVVSGPKFTRKLTTASYVKRVDGRYRDCLKR
jgi:hypothetical protein